MEHIEQRLDYLIKHQGLNHSRFAELIGVQRSSISHILTGRNKPSYDFLKKIFESFPDLNADWLIMGRGQMFHSAEDLNDSWLDVVEKPTAKKSTALPENGSTMGKPLAQQPEVVKKPEIIRKILVLFTDESFEEYHPRD